MSKKLIPTSEELAKIFADYVSDFFILPDPLIPRPAKLKKLMNSDEIKSHEGWNKHTCRMCNQHFLGGAGSGWTNLVNHILTAHKLGGSKIS